MMSEKTLNEKQNSLVYQQADNETREDNDRDSSKNDSADEEETELSEVDRYWPPPVEETITLTGSCSSKTISAFTFNNAGTRFAAGGHDHEIHIWDFEALDKQHPESINDVQPCGQTIIKHLEFSPNDESILVISGSCQAVIIAKDGTANNQDKCPKGDQYIADMANTKGHVQMLNDGCWNPKDSNIFITCSNDATIRVWDVNKLTQQKTIIKTRSPVNGLKTVPNVSKFSRDGLSIVAGCNDGSVMLWDTRRKFISTSSCIKNAHLKGSEITGIDFNYGMSKICTRSEDESCKVWDLRQMRQPLATRNELTTLYSTTDCCFSPDDKFVLTGASNTKQKPGQLYFLDSSDLTTQSSIETPETSVTRASWHPKINHIGYSCSNGRVFIAHDTKRSIGGLLTVAQSGRGTKRKKYISSNYQSSSTGVIQRNITPHALPLFRDDQSGQSFAKIRQDPKRSYKPEMPAPCARQGDRIKPAGSTLSSYIAKNIAKPIDDGGMSIRDRILRHANEEEAAAGSQARGGQGKPK